MKNKFKVVYKIIYQFIGTLLKEIEIELKWMLFKIGKRTKGTEGINSFNISITTQWFRRRILIKTIKSLILQKKIRTKIFIFTSSEDEERFRKSLKRFRRHGIEICSMKPDLKVYNKVFGPIQQKLKSNILVLDDDTYYPKEYLNDFEKIEIKSNTIYGTRGAIYIKNHKYNKFKNAKSSNGPKKDVILTGKGGILFTELARKEIAKSKAFMFVSPRNDDLWYFFYLRRIGFKFEVIQLKNNKFMDWFGESKGSLRSLNVDKEENDILIRKINNHFKGKKQIYQVNKG
jgi:hypothetical protein